VLEPVKQVQEKRARARQGSSYLDGHADSCPDNVFSLRISLFEWVVHIRVDARLAPWEWESPHTRGIATHRREVNAVRGAPAIRARGLGDKWALLCRAQKCAHDLHAWPVHGTVSPMANPLTPIDLHALGSAWHSEPDGQPPHTHRPALALSHRCLAFVCATRAHRVALRRGGPRRWTRRRAIRTTSTKRVA
jgi:hypothetical protein